MTITTELTSHPSLPVWAQLFKLGPTRSEGHFGQKDTEQSLGIDVFKSVNVIADGFASS